jgi:hypothetical protein
MRHEDTPQHLSAIVAHRPAWCRRRLSTILVWPTLHGGWTAILSHAHYTTVQPGETAPPGTNVNYPHDTQHSLALDGTEVAAALGAQVRELEMTGELGGLTVSRVAAPPWTAPIGPPSPGWTILTHSGSKAERRAWQQRIGQAV